LASFRLADTHRCARLACISPAGRQPLEAASGSYPLVDFVSGTFQKCSGKAIAEDIWGFRQSFSVLRGLTPG
jgi:hypothetical protein